MSRFLKLILIAGKTLKKNGFRSLIYKILIYFSKHLGDSKTEYFLNDSTERLAKLTLGIHKIKGNPDYSYSILVPVYKPDPAFFEQALLSYLNQTAPNFEVIVGYDGPQSDEVIAVTNKLALRYSNILKVYQFDHGGISKTTNSIAEKSTGRFLVLADHDDLIRPDLLWRYEQTLRCNVNTEDKMVLYCNELKVDKLGKIVPGSNLKKSIKTKLPYLFINTICHCLMVPRSLWFAVGGLRSKCDGSQDFDLALRLDLAGADFLGVPFYLYAWRVHENSTAKSLSTKDYATPAGVLALTEYVEKKGLDWKIEVGLYPTSYRAKCALPNNTEVHAIILYKDKKELTLASVHSLLKQKDVSVKITLVDNNSQDKSIALELEKLGCEVISINEPFNFSRLNNLAVQHSNYRATQNILIMNNDVELDENALAEMLPWLYQKGIGVVGCRLLYPNGKIQHGGVDLEFSGQPNNQLNWTHRNAGASPAAGGLSAVMGVCDAVTAACFMVKRETYEKLNGFDEVFYPVAFSDTDFCLRLKRELNLYSFYTPYASGVHHESASRGYANIEDYEGSLWLYKQRFLDQDLDIGIY